MTETEASAETHSPLDVPHEQFRAGVPAGHFRLIVNPERAQKYVKHRLFVVGIALPLLGISIVRNGLLIAAAGSAPTLTRIPLGSEVSLTFPEPAEVRIVLGGGERYRPENFAVRPVAVSVVGEPSRACWRGRPTVGRYDVLVDRGLHLGEPRVSMELSKICPETAAHTSAQLMDTDGYQVAER